MAVYEVHPLKRNKRRLAVQRGHHRRDPFVMHCHTLSLQSLGLLLCARALLVTKGKPTCSLVRTSLPANPPACSCKEIDPQSHRKHASVANSSKSKAGLTEIHVGCVAEECGSSVVQSADGKSRHSIGRSRIVGFRSYTCVRRWRDQYAMYVGREKDAYCRRWRTSEERSR